MTTGGWHRNPGAKHCGGHGAITAPRAPSFGIHGQMGAMSTLEERLSSAAAAVREAELVEQRIAELDRRCDDLADEVQACEAQFAAESDDADRLEGISLTRVLAAMRGARDDKLALERAEADAARLRMEHAVAQLAAVRQDRRAKQGRLDALAGAQETYEGALKEKEQLLKQVNDSRATRLFDLADEEGRILGEIRELAEAAEAAQEADEALHEVVMKLDSASSWSTYDTFFGGGALSSSIKHSRLDDAAGAAGYADQKLAVLRTELADVSDDDIAPRLHTDDGTRFLDVWLDNIFTDLAVRDHIKQAQANVAGAAQAVAEITMQLARRANAARDRLNEIDDERRAILLEEPPAQ